MSSRSQIALAGVALAVLWAVATTVGPFSDTTVNDLYVYRSYADLLSSGQLPYWNFGFEYPPLAALPLWLGGLRGTGEAAYAVTFGVLMAGCALVGQQLTARLAGAAHGASAAVSGACAASAARPVAAARGGFAHADPRNGVVVAWLLALAPIVIGASVRTHFDAFPIAIAIGALLLFARDRPLLGFALLGVGTMTKLFPGLLAVIAFAWLLGRGERRTAMHGAAIFAVVVLAISLPFASHGYVDSYTFHIDRPVQIESSPATVLFALGGSQVTGTNLRPDRFKSNGLAGGHADAVERLFTLLLIASLIGIVALAPRRRDTQHLVMCGFAALLAFVALGKVLSPQYVIWLAPFAALAWVWGRRAVALLVAAAIVLTHVEFPSRYFDLINQHDDVIRIVAARNALLLVALVVLTRWLGRPTPGEDPRAGHPVSAAP